ncbi:hypothetical protein ACOSQ4_005388 [Xanthoceras sorbifolium]
MGDSHQENDKGNRKGKGVEKLYKVWTLEESNELLRLMVDAAIRRWRDSNGLLSKVTLEKKILPLLMENLGVRRLLPNTKAVWSGLNNGTTIILNLCVITLSLDETM